MARSFQFPLTTARPPKRAFTVCESMKMNLILMNQTLRHRHRGFGAAADWKLSIQRQVNTRLAFVAFFHWPGRNEQDSILAQFSALHQRSMGCFGPGFHEL